MAGEMCVAFGVFYGRLVERRVRLNLDAAAVAQIVDESAPLYMFFLEIDSAPDLDDVDLRTERLIQKRDVDVLLDDLGEHLRTVKGRPIGPIDAIDDRRTVLNDLRIASSGSRWV